MKRTLSLASPRPVTFLQTVACCAAVGLAGLTPAAAQLGVSALTPSNGASDVCYDTPLRITFDSVPKVTTAGAIRIYNATNHVAPVEVIDLSLGNLQQRTFPGDAQPFSVYSVLIRDATATIVPHAGVMTSNQTYFVTIDAGVFTDMGDVPFEGIDDATTWVFTTRPTGPADPANLSVSADGTGDFATVQGAVNAVPPGNTTPTLIRIGRGDYEEIVNVSGKHNIVFRGADREGTVVGYANNADIAPGGTTHARMAFKVNGHDIALDNLTVTNRTPDGGSQAEALMIETDIKRFIANHVTVASYQDTILANTSGTQGYFSDCLVQGDTDFIWGGGNLFITNSEIKCLSTGSVITQPRTDEGSNGMSFVECRLTRSPGVSGCLFARPLGYGFSSVAFVRCLIDEHITGWDTSLLIGRGGIKNPNLRWWEYANSNLTATAAVVYQGHQIGEAEGDSRLEDAENAYNWLGGWEPQLLPNILEQPQSRYFLAGQSVGFSVEATGIPEPSYQWMKHGTNLTGATRRTLHLPGADAGDAGTYSVLVSNVAGAVTSAVAALTLVEDPVAPVVNSASVLGDGAFQFSFGGATGQPFSVWTTPDVTSGPVPGSWTLLSNGLFGTGSACFADTAATNVPSRYYSVTVP